jgi:hypothetical protein
MIDVPNPKVWTELRGRRPAYHDALETSPVRADGSDTGLLYGIDYQGDLHLLIPVTGGPASAKPPDLRGLRVRHRYVSDSREYLDLATSPAHERIFSPLCADVLDAVLAQRRQPWESVAATIRAWQSAWKPCSPVMEKALQVGLFGELLTLEHIMIPAIGSRAVHAWSGPEWERHDFVGDSLHLEVKTTRKRRHEHEISRLDQLRVPAGRRLIVVSIMLEESLAGTESLATRIDAVGKLLLTDAEASDVFQAKLVQLGWSDEMRRTGELLRFHPEFSSLIFAVDGTFPRLPDDFVPPTGVIAVRYTVDLANLPSLDMEEALDAVSQGFGFSTAN